MTANQQKLYKLVEQAKVEADKLYNAKPVKERGFALGQGCAFRCVLDYLNGDPFPLKVWAGKLKEEG